MTRLAILMALVLLPIAARADVLGITHRQAEKLYYNSHGNDYVTDRLGVSNPAGGVLFPDPDSGYYYLCRQHEAEILVTREDRLPTHWFPFQDKDWDGDGIKDGLRAYDENGVVLTAMFSRSTTGTYLGSDGLIHTAAIDTPRYGYYNMSSLTYGGVLLENSATNYIKDSSAFDSWEATNVTVNANTAASPVFGNTTSADTLRTTDPAGFVSYSTSATSNSYYCFSVYLKGASATSEGYISIGQATNGFTNYSTPLTTDWQRFDVGANLTTEGEGVECRIYNGQAGTDVYAFGGQLEGRSFPTSYIPTSGTTVTRGEDVLMFVKPSGFDSAGTLILDYTPIYDQTDMLYPSGNNIHIVQEVDTSARNTQSVLYHYTVANPMVLRTRDTSSELTGNMASFARENTSKLGLSWGVTRTVYEDDTSIASGEFSGSIANTCANIRLMKGNFGFVRNLIIFDRSDVEVSEW